MRAFALFPLLFALGHEPRAPRVHDLHCAGRFPPTYIHGVLYPGCQSERHVHSRTWYDDGAWHPHDPTRLGTVWWADDREPKTDDEQGYLCDACARILDAERTPRTTHENEYHAEAGVEEVYRP